MVFETMELSRLCPWCRDAKLKKCNVRGPRRAGEYKRTYWVRCEKCGFSEEREEDAYAIARDAPKIEAEGD